ncbi:MAG: hypothetical protein K8T90_19915 [Planctomycetes bacterium]|nr:hypothetical protein [Planctomycetota bacterium]
MRPTYVLAVLCVPALALAQDAAQPAPTGTLLWDALPPGADLVIHTPNLPQLLASAPDVGFGTAAAWGAAFDAQLRTWGEASGEPGKLVAAGGALLRMADGEAVLASMELPRIGSATAPRTRCVFFAFRTRSKEKELRAAVDDIISAGLSTRWPGAPRVEQTMGRPVISLSAPHDGLWLRVQDGLVAVSDHPLALGLFFRGLERVAREVKPPEDVSAIRLHVRHGRFDSAARWEGVTFLEREAVSSPLRDGLAVSGAAFSSKTEPDGLMSWITGEAGDLPILPQRLPDDVVERAKSMNARPLALRLQADGSWTVSGAGGVPSGEKPIVGGASRLGWLRAMAAGTLPCPVPIDTALLAGPAAAAETAQKDMPLVLDWRPTDDPGELRGPAWHGPLTFLALRTLHDIVHGRPPFAPPPVEPEAPPKPTVPLPEPVPPREEPRVPNAPGQAPPKPDAPLPVPGDGR